MIKIVLAQHNFHVGNIQNNSNKIIAVLHQAREANADLVIFPELALTGYPPEDLLLREDFERTVESHLDRIAQHTHGLHVVIGYPRRQGKKLFNAAGLFLNGQLLKEYHKHHLPNYGVFDELRYFTPGDTTCVFDIKGIKFGLIICEDVWHPGPFEKTAAAGAKIMLVINASPFDYEKPMQRIDSLQARQKNAALPIVYCNLIGGQDDLVFDGGSFVLDKKENCVLQAPFFKECLLEINIEEKDYHVVSAFAESTARLTKVSTNLNKPKLIYDALVLATRDYVQKNGFEGALIGLSGGIDSALTLAIAVDALGAAHVETLMMPSQYTAAMSLEDAKIEADILGVKHHIIPIENTFEAFLKTLAPHFEGFKKDTTEENLQARCRGTLLMAFSNKLKKLVLTTGNKSEMAMGYATLYGDMAGSFAVLRDVSKCWVYELANYRNSLSPVIPERVITRPPSAELAPDQKDADSLPPYPMLDAILERYVEHDESIENIINAGFDPDTVKRVARAVKMNEYKRRQAAVGPKISPRAYGKERRYPITNGY